MPALQLRAELVALRARLRRLGVIGVAAAAGGIRREPPLDERRLRVGRGGKSKDEAGRGKRQRDGQDDPPRPPPAPCVRARASPTIIGRPHTARVSAARSRCKRFILFGPVDNPRTTLTPSRVDWTLNLILLFRGVSTPRYGWRDDQVCAWRLHYRATKSPDRFEVI